MRINADIARGLRRAIHLGRSHGGQYGAEGGRYQSHLAYHPSQDPFLQLACLRAYLNAYKNWQWRIFHLTPLDEQRMLVNQAAYWQYTNPIQTEAERNRYHHTHTLSEWLQA